MDCMDPVGQRISMVARLVVAGQAAVGAEVAAMSIGAEVILIVTRRTFAGDLQLLCCRADLEGHEFPAVERIEAGTNVATIRGPITDCREINVGLDHVRASGHVFGDFQQLVLEAAGISHDVGIGGG